MSHELNLAIALPGQPLLFAVPAALVLIVVIALVVRKLRAKGSSGDAWASAAHELGIEVAADPDIGQIVRGRVNDHVVTVSPVNSGKGRKARKSTQYGVKFEATEAPQFRMIKRNGHDMPTVDTGNPKFDAVVVVQTDQPTLLAHFLTPARRAAILRVLTYWPEALISNRDVHLTTNGIEDDHDAIVDAVCHLVATAETFDRITRPATDPAAAAAAPAAPVAAEPAVEAVDPNYQPNPPAPAAEAPDPDFQPNPPAPAAEAPDPDFQPNPPAPTAEAPDPDFQPNPPAPAAEAQVVAAPPAPTGDPVPEADVLTEVRLDEVTVLSDLFGGGLQPDQSAARFEQIYQGRDVAWTGEVVRVGPPDEQGRQRIAALIGSADGQNPDSGRVVALTSVPAEPVVTPGDIVGVSGALVNLDAGQRLFHIA